MSVGKIELIVDCRLTGGIGRTIQNLVPLFSKSSMIQKLTLIGKPDVLKAWPVDHSKTEIIPFSSRAYSIQEQFIIRKIWARKNALLFVPHYNIPVLWAQLKRPMVVAIHDLIHFSPHIHLNFLQRAYAEMFCKMAISKSRQIVTVSDFSKRDIVMRFPRATGKVVVIPNAIDASVFHPDRLDFRCKVSEKIEPFVTKPYVMTATSIRPHKNLNTLLRTFVILKTKFNIPQRLLIVGQKEGFILPARLDNIESGMEKEIVFTGFVSDDDLRVLYSNTDCFIFPSFYEGFGLPPLEAMACGAPVVCSNASSLPEVVGDAALLCDPHSVDEFVSAVLNVLRNKELQKRMSEKSLRQSRQFSWPESASRYLDVFAKAAGFRSEVS